MDSSGVSCACGGIQKNSGSAKMYPGSRKNAGNIPLALSASVLRPLANPPYPYQKSSQSCTKIFQNTRVAPQWSHCCWEHTILYCKIVHCVLQGAAAVHYKCIDYSQRFAWQRLRPRRSVPSSPVVSRRGLDANTSTGCARRARATRRRRCSCGSTVGQVRRR